MFHLGIHIVLIAFICVCAVSLLCLISGIVMLRDGNKQVERARRARRRLRAESLRVYSGTHKNEYTQI
jgi:hypothetical protein